MFRDAMNDHVYEYDEIIIGNTLSSLIYSYFNEVPVFFVEAKKPFMYDFFREKDMVEKMQINPVSFRMQGPSLTKVVGNPKYPIYNRLNFVLSMSGLMPTADKARSIRIENDNLLKISLEGSKNLQIKFNKARIFDDTKIQGLEVPFEKTSLFQVVDWINVRSGAKHEFDVILTPDDFIKEVYFYPSVRIPGSVASNKKDLVSVSYLTSEQIKDFEYSDTYAKFKIKHLMEEAGIKGRSNGNNRFLSIKIESSKREIIKCSFDRYEDNETLVFDYRPEETVLRESMITANQPIKLNRMMSARGRKIRK